MPLRFKTEEEYERWRQERAHRDPAPVPAANVECGVTDKQVGAKQVKALDVRCSIHLHSKRHRLTDADGVCAKYVIDALIHVGLLRDDSPRWVSKVSFSQEKTRGPEETIITITPEK